MKRFDFNLQRILSLREYREKEWEIKLGEITGVCTRLRQEIAARDRLRREALRRRYEMGAEDVCFARSTEDYMQRMKVEALRLSAELEKAEVKRQAIQKQYLEASRAKKALENLKSKRQKEYYKEQLKAESGIIDEMNINAAVRKLREPVGNGAQVLGGSGD